MLEVVVVFMVFVSRDAVNEASDLGSSIPSLVESEELPDTVIKCVICGFASFHAEIVSRLSKERNLFEATVSI